MDGFSAKDMETVPLQRFLYRSDPPSPRWIPPGWQVARIPWLSLAISNKAIEVRGLGPVGKVLQPLFGIRLSLPPREMVMWTTEFSDFAAYGTGGWRLPWLKREWLVLRHTRSDSTKYTVAIRPADGNFDQLRAALRTAGVSES